LKSYFIAIIWLIAFLSVLASTEARSGKSKKRPPNLQCWGTKIETYGSALILDSKFKGKIGKKEKKILAGLATRDAVQLSHVSSILPTDQKYQLIDIKIDGESVQQSFESFDNFVRFGKFKESVPIRAAAVIDKNESAQDKKELQKAVNSLDNLDLKDLWTKISHRWKITQDNDQVIIFQLDKKQQTIFGAIGLHDGTEDCLTMEFDEKRPILPPGVDEKKIPENYLFNLPVAPPFEVSYFYGPRIFNSMNVSLNLERKPSLAPKKLKRDSKPALEYLNQYWHFHTGVDFAVVSGTPIYAPYDGYVFAAGRMGCAGETIVLAHSISGSDQLIFSVYEHLLGASHFAKVVLKDGQVVRPYRSGEKLSKGESTRKLQVGDPVYQGSFIAKSGSSGKKIGFSRGFKEGCVGGAHLHFELRVPKASSAEIAKELAFEHKAKRSYDMGKRFRFLQFETTAVNPADFIHGLDVACQSRKNIEIKNASALRNVDKKAVPPLTAGLCSYKYEKSLGKIPPIYKLTRIKQADLPLSRNPSGSLL